jgi:hypothetical protein
LILGGIAIAAYLIFRKKAKPAAQMSPDEKAEEILKRGGADVTASFAGDANSKAACEKECSDLGFGVLRYSPCYCKQTK